MIKHEDETYFYLAKNVIDLDLVVQGHQSVRVGVTLTLIFKVTILNL